MNQPLMTKCPPAFVDPVPVKAGTCAEHGEYESHQISPGMPELGMAPVWSSCPTCRAESEAQRQEARLRAAAIAKRREVARLFERCGIPPRFADRTLANYRAETPGQAKALSTAELYVKNWREVSQCGTSLVLTGEPGTGKTHIACAVASGLIESYSVACAFMSVSEALRSIKATYAKDCAKTEQQAIHDLLTPDLLILDEIGMQVGSEHEKQLMFEVLNGRYQNLRPTILISNLSRADLAAFLGQRVMDRYAECGAVIAFDWESHRGKK